MNDHHDDDRLLGRLLGPPGRQLTCEECFDELDRYVDAELDGRDADGEVPGMREHLAGCPACADDHESLREYAGRSRGA